MPIVAFGFEGSVTVVDRPVLSGAQETGILADPRYFGDAARVIPLHDEAYIVLPCVPLPPKELLAAISAIPRHPTAIRKHGDINHSEVLDGSSAKKILEKGRSKSFFFASLFFIDGSPLWRRIQKCCVHALPGTIEVELFTYVSRILGQSGYAFITPEGRSLGVYFSHNDTDPELIADQVSMTLRKALSLHNADDIVIGPFLSAAIGSDISEPMIRSFIDGA